MRKIGLKKTLYVFILPYLVISGYVILISIFLRSICVQQENTINFFLTAFRINDIHFVTMITISHAFSMHILSKDTYFGMSPLYRWRDLGKTIIICMCLSLWVNIIGYIAILPYGTLDVNKWRILGLEATVSDNAVSRYLHLSGYAINSLRPFVTFILSILFLTLHLLLISLLYCRRWRSTIVFVIITAAVCYGDFQAYNELPSWAAYLFPGSVLRCSFDSSDRIAYTFLYYIVLIILVGLTAWIIRRRKAVQPI